MRAAAALVAELDAAERHREPRADVVAESDGAQEMLAADRALLAERERRGNDGGAGMRLRRAVRVVRLVRVREHAVDERGVHRAGEDCSSPTTVAAGRPACARASASAATPGGSSEPDTIAANVSRMWCFAFSATSHGSARSFAAAM